MSKGVACFGALFAMMLSCGICHIGSGPLLDYKVHALEPSPYPESTFIAT